MNFKAGDLVISIYRRESRNGWTDTHRTYRIQRGEIIQIYTNIRGDEILRIKNDEGNTIDDYSFDWKLDVEEIRNEKLKILGFLESKNEEVNDITYMRWEDYKNYKLIHDIFISCESKALIFKFGKCDFKLLTNLSITIRLDLLDIDLSEGL